MAMNPVCFTKYRCKYGKMTIINYRPHGKSFQEHDTLNGSMHRKTHAVNLSSPFWFSASSLILHLFRFNNAEPVQ